MGIRQDLEAELARIQAKLTALNSVPEDTFNLGTVVVFSATGLKWYYVKTEEENWKKLGGTSVAKQLAQWILDAVDSSIGYFEVYKMEADVTPIYAKP